MSGMSEFEVEMQRFLELDRAVRNYLACLQSLEAGKESEAGFVAYWRDRLDELTSDAVFETFGGDKFDKYGNPVEVD